jgi:hypothetical protein
MNPTTHPGVESLSSWVAASAPFEVASSVEQHLLRCGRCRQQVAELRHQQVPDPAPDGPLAARGDPLPHPAPRPSSRLPDFAQTWARVEDAVLFPGDSRIHRAMVRMGLREGDATLLSRAPSTRVPWTWAVVTAVAFVLAATALGREGRTALFLLLAPVVPMAGVSLAYGPARGPELEQLAPTPYPAVRLVALRTLAVVASCLPVLLLASIVVPEQVARWWLLPAAGFSAAILGLSSWVSPSRAVLGLGLAWTGAVSAATRLSEPALVLAPGLLWLYASLVVVGPLVFVLRARHLGTLGRIS